MKVGAPRNLSHQKGPFPDQESRRQHTVEYPGGHTHCKPELLSGNRPTPSCSLGRATSSRLPAPRAVGQLQVHPLLSAPEEVRAQDVPAW